MSEKMTAEQAWAEVDYEDSIHEIAFHERKAAQMRENSALARLREAYALAEAIGPRPVKEPS